VFDIIVDPVVSAFRRYCFLLKSKDSDLCCKDSDTYLKNCFKRSKIVISELLEKNRDVEEIKKIAWKLVQITYGRYDFEFNPFGYCMAEKLFNEALLPTSKGLSDFWQLPVPYFLKWIYISVQERLTFNQAKTLLAWLWIYCNSRPSSYFTYDDVVEITGMSKKTVGENLAKLAGKNLIDRQQPDSHYYLNDVVFKDSPESNLEIDLDQSIVASFGIEIDINKIEKIQYIYFSNVRRKNPFVCTDKILPKEDIKNIRTFREYIDARCQMPDSFIVHKQILKIDYFLASVLTEKELRKYFLQLSGTNANVARSVKMLREKVRQDHDCKYAIPIVPPELNEHYHQIYKVLPILHFVARRDFSINPIRGAEFDALYSSRIKVLYDGIMTRYKDNPAEFIKENKLPSKCANYGELIDFKIVCPKILKKDKKEKARTEEDKKIKFIFRLGSLTVKTELIRDKNLLEWNTYSWLLKDLQSVLDHAKQYYYGSIANDFSVLDNLTHRVYFRNMSTQNINKANRKVFCAGKNYQFFMIDISQMELQLLKLYINNEQGPGEFDRVTFDMMAREIGVERSSVKIAFYKWFYGAGESTIMENPEITDEKYRGFIKFMDGFQELKIFREKLEKEADNNHCTRRTPLGYQMPLDDRFYRATSCLIQATGAEIFIRWVLELHEKQISQYIVNLIHDEIIFKIPVEKNLYDFAKTVKACLDIASREISKWQGRELYFEAKQFVAKYWDKESGAEIILKG